MYVFKNFKCFSEAKLDVSEPVTLLIGPNASGKTNLIEGIELLADLSRGISLNEVANGRSASIRGGLASCPRFGEQSFALGFTTLACFMEELSVLKYEVEVSVKPRPHISREALTYGADTLIFETWTAGTGEHTGVSTVRYNNFDRGGNKPQETVPSDRSALSQYDRIATNNRQKEECLKLVQSLLDDLGKTILLEPDPREMRAYARIDRQPLARDASNLSSVLYLLQQKADQGDETAQRSIGRLLDCVRQVPEEPYESIEFVTTKLEDVIISFHERPQGPLVDARVLSDGTLRCLAALAAVETFPDQRVIIEEFDSGLHPSRVHLLAEAIFDAAKRNRLKVLATTHNPAALDALGKDQLASVYICTRDIEKESSRIVRLTELPRFIEFMESGKLGDLVTRRIVDAYLAPGFEEKRKKRMLEWMKSLP